MLFPIQAARLSGAANEGWEERKQGFESAKGRFYCALETAIREHLKVWIKGTRRCRATIPALLSFRNYKG